MTNDTRKPLMQDFWQQSDTEPDRTLYSDQLGWQRHHIVESGGYVMTKDLWDHLIGYADKNVAGWDLCFFYVPNETFYYLDQMAKVIYKLPLKHCSSCALTAKVDMRPQVVPESDEVFDYDDISQVWSDFTIDGHHLSYIIANSVLFLCT